MEKSVDNRTFYKGNLVFLGKNKWLYDKKRLSEYDYKQKKMVLDSNLTLNDNESSNLKYYLNGFFKSCYVTRKDIVKILDNLFKKIKPIEKIEFEQIELPIIFTIEGNLAREVHTGITFPIITDDDIKFDYEIQVNDYPKSNKTEYMAISTIKVDFKDFKNIKVAVNDYTKAKKDEVNHYFGMFGWFRANQKKKAYQDKIEALAKKNTSLQIENSNLKRLDESISLMEKIEYKLANVNKRNPNFYQELKKDYEEIKRNHNPKEQLINFSNMLDVVLTFNLPYKIDILGYIGKVKAIYMLNIHNLEFNKFNFYHIEAMTDLLYQQQSSYSVMEIRTAELALATIYLLEIYKNKDLINDMWVLENSYVKDLLQTIVLCMITLKNDGVITLDEDINLDEELNVSKVFIYIQNMKIENSMEK